MRVLRSLAGRVIAGGDVTVALGTVDRALGRLALAMGEPKQAVAYLEQALALAERMRDRPWAVLTRIDLARATLATAGLDDGAKALRVIEAAMTAATDIGMEYALRQCEELRAKLRGVLNLQ